MTGRSAVDQTDVRLALEALKNEDVQYFGVDDLVARNGALAGARPKDVEQTLMEMWRSEELIYPDAIRTDGTHSWAFGFRPPPNTARRPIGGRR